MTSETTEKATSLKNPAQDTEQQSQICHWEEAGDGRRHREEIGGQSEVGRRNEANTATASADNFMYL